MIIVSEVYVLLIVLLAASGGWSAAVQTFGLRVQPRVVLVGVLLAGALSVAALVGYAVVGAWAPLVEELVGRPRRRTARIAGSRDHRGDAAAGDAAGGAG